MKRWHHGHSIGTGVIGGLLVAQHAWLIFTVGVVVGIIVAYLRQSAAWVADKVAHWREFGPSKLRRFPDGPVPVYRVPRARRDDDTVPF